MWMFLFVNNVLMKKRCLSCRKCTFMLFLVMIFVHWQHIMLKKKKKKSLKKCFVYLVNGLLWEPYVLLLVDSSNFSSSKDKEGCKKKYVCCHCFQVISVCSAHLSFCHVVECPFAPNKRWRSSERCGKKQQLYIFLL